MCVVFNLMTSKVLTINFFSNMKRKCNRGSSRAIWCFLRTFYIYHSFRDINDYLWKHTNFRKIWVFDHCTLVTSILTWAQETTVEVSKWIFTNFRTPLFFSTTHRAEITEVFKSPPAGGGKSRSPAASGLRKKNMYHTITLHCNHFCRHQSSFDGNKAGMQYSTWRVTEA